MSSVNSEFVLFVFIAWICSLKLVSKEWPLYPIDFLGQELQANSYTLLFSNVFHLGTDVLCVSI
jgi:hypothetical protein